MILNTDQSAAKQPVGGQSTFYLLPPSNLSG